MSVPLRQGPRRINPVSSPLASDAPPLFTIGPSSPSVTPSDVPAASSPATFPPECVGVGVGRAAKKEKAPPAAQSPYSTKIDDSLLCVDFLPAFNALAIGCTRSVRILEVTEQATSQPRAGAPMAFRDCGMFGNVAKIESLAWYPAADEATLAIVQLSRNVTILLDCLALKGGSGDYMAQQWIRNAAGRSVASAVPVGHGLLNSAYLGNVFSVPSTPGVVQQQQNPPIDAHAVESVPTAKRTAPGAPRAMIEVSIDTSYTCVERIAWDPHNPYTLALTTDTTHFELWTVPIIANTVYQPKLVLRPPAHNEQATTRGVAFSPSDPHLIIVVVEVANAGQVIVYDRRQVEVPRRLATTGPCITLAFHPTYCDLLAVCYIKKKTLRDSRVQFFRVLDETSTPHRDIRPPVVEQHVIPPIDTFDPLHPIRWRPSISRFSGFSPDTEASHNSATLISTANDYHGYGPASINNSSNNIVDTISSQIWFATGVQNNAQDIDIWDAANGFCPIFSLRGLRDNCKKKDCVWISPLSLVSIFMGGEVVLTSLLDDSAEGRNTLFRLPGGSAEMKNMDVFSLSAVLPTAAVVSDYFGRSFVVRNTSSQLREYYTRVVRAESCEWAEQLAARRARLSVAKSTLMNRSNPTAAIMPLESTTGTPIRGYGAGSALLSPHQRSLQATHSPYLAQNSVTSFASSVVSLSSVKGHQTPMVAKPSKEWEIKKTVMRFFSSSSEKAQEANVAKQQQKKASSRPQGTASTTPTPSSGAMVVDTMCTPLSNSEFLTCDKTQLTVLVTAPRGSSDTAFEFVFPTLLSLAGKEVAPGTTIPEINRSGAVVANSRAIDIASPVSDITLHTFNSLDERQWQRSSSTLRTAACSHGAQQKILLSPLEGHLIESSNSSGRNHVLYFGSCQTIMRSPASPTPSEEDNMCRRPVGLRSMARKVNPSGLGLPNIWKTMPSVTNHASPVVSRGSVVETSPTLTSLPILSATTATAVAHPVFPSSPCALNHRRIDDEWFRAPKACEMEWESKTGLLGSRSRVSPMIERFVLSDETCSWAYVERSAEGEAFVLYAREWQVGYETARQMHNARHNDPGSDDNNNINNDDEGNDNDNDGIAHGTNANAGNHAQTVCEAMSVMGAHHEDRRFAHMAEHNARVCEAHERDLLEYNSRSHRLHSAMSLNTYHHHVNLNSSSYYNSSNAAVDPRAQLWAAVAHALRSHDVSLVTTLVTSQLDYVSLLGDAQYCIVLYLLYGLWWRKRHCCMRCHPCPLVPRGNDDHNNDHNNKKNNKKNCSSHPHCTRVDPVDSDGARKAAAADSLETARRRWWLRALQWLEQYVTWLHACGLHVALNELLLIVPHVTGEPFNPVHPRAADIRYKKQLTSVCCGMCRNAALVPCAITQAAVGAASKSTNSAPPKLRAVEWDRGDAWGSEDDDDDDDDESGCTFSDSFSSATTTREPAVSISSTPMNNASCRLCNSRAHMVCVICEEIVEGVYFSLRGCGHGGHVHHIEEWLRLSNECPRCGEPIQSQSVAQATV